MGDKNTMADADSDALFWEWTDLFRLYRDQGKLPPDLRQRFRDLTEELKRRGLLDTSNVTRN